MFNNLKKCEFLITASEYSIISKVVKKWQFSIIKKKSVSDLTRI